MSVRSPAARPREPRADVRALTPGELAWTAAPPVALLTLAAIVVLGPVLGHALLEPGREAFWTFIEVDPQPLEHGRFLVGLAGPPLLAALVLRGRLRRRALLAPRTIRRLVAAGQATLIAFVVLCFAAQNNVLFSADFPPWAHRMYFKWPTLLVALVVPPLALWRARRSPPGARVAALLRETPARRLVCVALAVLYTAIWMLTAIDLDSSIGNTTAGVAGHLLWTMAEPFAVLDGRTPLVNYHAQYGQLWAYLAAVPMALFGASIGTYTTFMATCSGLVMVTVYGTFRRLVRSSLAALALYLPFLATAFFTIYGPLANRYGPSNLFLLWPIRYAGPFLLAWLTARHLDDAPPRRAWPIFALGGLVALNNPDFGLAAVAATLTAIVAATPVRTRAAAGRIAAEALGGMLGAIASVALFTLARSGSLPHFGLLFEFSRLYGIEGWAQEAMPELGLHLVVFLTFAAALVLAAARLARGDEDERPLTGLLAWSGAFGLLASVYWAGRAHPLALFDFFAPWAFTLVLLTLVVLRALAARGWRRPAPAELAVLFGLGLVACSLPQTPTPWSQIARIRDRTPTPIFEQLEGERMIRAETRRGEKVAILTALGHRIAYDLGLVNVSPYSSIESIPTRRLLERAVAVFRHEGVRQLYLETRFTHTEELEALLGLGYQVRRHEPRHRYTELVDRSFG